MEDFYLNIWRLHPDGIRITPAEKTLNGTAHPEGVKYCGPFSTANKTGWWVFPPRDIGIRWDGENFQVRNEERYSPADADIIRKLIKPTDNVNPDKWCPRDTGRTKFGFGSVEKNVVQIWTGVILQTPPGWSLRIRSPVNFPPQDYYVMEGVLETDWMWYDLWINMVVHKKNQWIDLKKDQWPPLAHLIPERREINTCDWKVTDQPANRETQKANDVFSYWLQYNYKKFECGGKQALSSTDPTLKKDATTYYTERKRLLDKEKMPVEGLQQCPFHQATKKIKRRLLKTNKPTQN